MRTRRFFDVNSIAVDILKTEDGNLLITTINGDTRMKLSPENAGVIRTALNEYLGPDDAAKLMDVELSEHEKQMVEIHASSMVQMISSQVALMASAMSSQAAQMVELINLTATSKLSPLGEPAFDIDPQFSRPSPGVTINKAFGVGDPAESAGNSRG